MVRSTTTCVIPDYPRLLWAGRWWLLAAVILFLTGCLAGYAATLVRPQVVVEQMRPLFGAIEGIATQVANSESPIWRSWVIFRNNARSVLFMLAGGALLGVVPAAATFMNGTLLGIVAGLGARLSPLAVSPLLLLLAIAPHGIFELPALWIGAAWGMRLGLSWLWPSAQGRRRQALRASAVDAVRMVPLILILLVIAAAVEGNLTLALVRFLRT